LHHLFCHRSCRWRGCCCNDKKEGKSCFVVFMAKWHREANLHTCFATGQEPQIATAEVKNATAAVVAGLRQPPIGCCSLAAACCSTSVCCCCCCPTALGSIMHCQSLRWHTLGGSAMCRTTNVAWGRCPVRLVAPDSVLDRLTVNMKVRQEATSCGNTISEARHRAKHEGR